MWASVIWAGMLLVLAICCREVSALRAPTLKPIVHRARLSGLTRLDHGRSQTEMVLRAVPAAEEGGKDSDGFDLKAWFNPNTRGGVIVWCVLLLAVPIGAYNYLVSTGLEDTKAGGYVGAIFVLLSNLLWASTYVFRVATKDMTYAKQLRDYENAVLQKRLEELADDEIEALMQEIEIEDQPAETKKD